MALNAYLVLKGAVQGSIKGNVIQKGREGWIEVNAYHHGISSPRDMATGQASGKRQHGQLKITKQIDQSTPLLYKALCTNENLTEFELKFFSPNTLGQGGGSGVETNSFKIVLKNASIVSINEEMLHNKMPENTAIPVLEQVCFVYEKITWTWVTGNKTAEDNWLVTR